MKRVGVIGGGQLGRMLIQAAIDLDIKMCMLDPDEFAPCKEVAHEFVLGSRTDFDTVYQFGKDKDVVTIEIENINVDALEKLEQEGKKVFPQPSAIRIIQDKRLQKQFYEKHQIPTAPYVLIDSKEDLAKNADFLPAFMKLGKEGYDGKGVVRLDSAADFDKAFEKPSLLEKLVDIDKELAVIVSRNEAGEINAFPAVELVFDPKYNLVDYLLSPAIIDESVAQKAKAIAIEVINAFDMVGILAVEMFLTKSGEIWVNEVAPRPHNSGHHTIKANYTSQFEQHLRSILNLPLGDSSVQTPAAMINIIGSQGYTGDAVYEGTEKVLQTDGAYIHLYGKKITKPGRKMGHITIMDRDIEQIKQKVKDLKGKIIVKTQ